MVMNKNALRNNQLTSHKIQKDMIHACATKLRKAVNEIEGKFIFLLVNEARDSSVNKQMSAALTFVMKKKCPNILWSSTC